ncbi:flagellar hook-associated protein 3 [Azoarcus indigens]|uniref:Flagellar hook-associated protein 3 FlgL n=1 Tax=Azoarcus indigens TaxID=29545 RepID=A0A4V6PQJ6_9RHOO|nr:flagellar hook-associated protein FlgL [Azoarcus indigens]NMG64424.1 flagellar hook-associated protein 3 [Azoarcus indigens]TDN48362.1 flagellar hook-associated protein 3 FlgL [Azoarcus indigens]
MRISTNMIYDKGVGSMQRQWSDLLHTQQQLSTGRRVLTPADDPIAASRALEIGQSQGVNTQFMTNTGYAEDRLKLLENKLTGVDDTLQYIREKTVAAGNGIYKEEDLGYLATDLRAQFDSLLALANSQDGTGDYLFSGYRSNVQPFSGSVAGVSYAGDYGTQTIQVSASRYMPVSLPGSDIFTATREVNDDLVAALTGEHADGTANTGDASLTGTLAPLADGSIDMDKLGRRYEIVYNDPAGYDVYEYEPGNPDRVTIATGLADLTSLADPTSPNYIGVNLAVSGTPGDGDRFEVFVSSNNMFDNLGLLIDSMERPGPSGMAGGAVAVGLDNLDGALENILKVRAQVGSQLTETESLQSLGSDLNLQYSEVISGLMDVDYVDAISRLAQQQTYLQAAQQSFMQVSNLSLFNYL